jgi:TonB family protein
MNVARGRKLFIAAVFISLLAHLILAGYIRWPLLQQSQEEKQLAKVHVMRVARIVPPTPPPPTPAPTPAATPRVRASIQPPTVTRRGTKGPTIVKTVPVSARTPAPKATTVPTPVASATPSGPCGGHANADPTVAATPDAADITPEARSSKVSGTAAVHVSLDAQGRVVDTSVAQSSGNVGLDAAAVQMARNATYTPKYVDCKAVAGDYTFTVKFVAW